MEPERRGVRYHSLDALRAFVLLLGIVFHAAESFCPGRRSWAIIDLRAHIFFDMFQHVCHSFRMEVFFLIAGFFAHRMLQRSGTGGFVRNRARRILVPLVGGWFLLYPTIMLIWVWGKWTTGSLSDLRIPAEMQSMNPFALTAGVILSGAPFREAFNLAHLWFLYYLILLYLLLLAFRWTLGRFAAAGRLLALLDGGFDRVLHSGWRIPFFALLCLPLTTWMGGGVDTPNQTLVPNLPVVALYGLFFGFGCLLHRRPERLDLLARNWGTGLIFGLAVLWPVCSPRTLLSFLFPGGGFASWARTLHLLLYPVMMWSLALALTGFFLAVCRRESRIWRYLADSSYWLYLVHHTVVVPIQILIAGWDFHPFLKLLLILALAFPVLLASYHYLVRPTFLGLLLNGRRHPRSNVGQNGVLSAAALQTEPPIRA